MIEVKLNFTIQLTDDSKSHPADFNRLIGFFANLNKIHSSVIKQCCEDYSKTYPNQKLREEHKLKFDTSEKENFLHFSLFFQISNDELELYLTLTKLFFDFCENYGKDTNHLAVSIHSVKAVLNKIKRLFKKVEAPDSKTKNDSSILKLYHNLMGNNNFRKAYNSFCKTGITINEFISNIQLDGEDVFIDFLD